MVTVGGVGGTAGGEAERDFLQKWVQVEDGMGLRREGGK